jgi:peptidyl-prolyl cis-trans isomerase SurA
MAIVYMKMRFLIFCFSLCLLTMSKPIAVYAQDNASGIAAVVNQDAITIDELNDRVVMIIQSSGLPDNVEMRTKLRPQILQSLIDESLRLQEAEKLKQILSDAEIQAEFAQVARNNKMTEIEFSNFLEKQGVNPATLKAQIKANLAWTKVVQTKIRPLVDISESQIDAYAAQLKESTNKTEYDLAEIFLPITDPKKTSEVQQLAQKLEGEIRARRAPFPAVAEHFSQAASASKQGRTGWIRLDQFDPEIQDVIVTLKKGELSPPIKTNAGYTILLILDQRTLTPQTMPKNGEIMNMLGNQQMDRKQRQYFRDLKSKAFIEYRV